MRSARAHLNLDTSTIFLSGSTCKRKSQVHHCCEQFFLVCFCVWHHKILGQNTNKFWNNPPQEKRQTQKKAAFLPASTFLFSTHFFKCTFTAALLISSCLTGSVDVHHCLVLEFLRRMAHVGQKI